MTTTQCIKVASLRKETGDPDMTLEKWLDDPRNVYVGRPGRIFIGSGDDKRIFHYPGSKYANIYVDGTREEVVKKYRKYLKDSGLTEDIRELLGKNLGCWCDQAGECHAKVLLEYLKTEISKSK